MCAIMPVISIFGNPPPSRRKSLIDGFAVCRSMEGSRMKSIREKEKCFQVTWTGGQPVMPLKNTSIIPQHTRKLLNYSMRKFLILTNKTFSIENPHPGEQAIPTKLVLKAKSLADGSLDKLATPSLLLPPLRPAHHHHQHPTLPPSTHTPNHLHVRNPCHPERVPQASPVPMPHRSTSTPAPPLTTYQAANTKNSQNKDCADC